MTTYAATMTICDKNRLLKLLQLRKRFSFLHYLVRTDHFCEIQHQLTL